MTVPGDILRLVETFGRNIEAYKSGSYNETQVRHEFIDPFFESLGWDINNRQGHAEAYKDVIHEDAIKIGDSTKAPDYCFRIGGTRKFFVEAKKPSVNIKDDIAPAFQLRRYAWSSKLPLSIVTDFEEFAVYDCRIKPVKTDKASVARVKYFNFKEYPDRWKEIASIFSHDAILKGSFDKYAVSRKRRGTAEVDDAFLSEIEKWREILAKNIALRNHDLTNRQLNFAVQRTIDRIIFLRIAEDRGLEQYGELLALKNGHEVYKRLLFLFQKADDRYNSGLFHFTREKNRPEGPDELTPSITIDDTVLKNIFKTLYYPDSPYEFSVLPAEILGHVYEQFLGKIITLTAGHRAKIEEKPEVKKAGGVYYTPKYIVDYIVGNTVGKLLESRTVKHFKTKTSRMDLPLTICDPACGSGSFLLGAYQYLLDWYLKYYTENNSEQWLKSKSPPISTTTTSTGSHANYKLTVSERKRILLDHIYGVDIDTQAVEVTKLSLLLKVLEGEKSQMLFATKRALPDLANNIKCGNSLIAPDFYQNQQMLMFDEEKKYKINAFDWKQGFPDIFKRKNPGFDAIIGNPPYIRVHRLLKDHKEYFWHHFTTFVAKSDIYACFIERGVNFLREDGILSYITPNTWTSLESFTLLRKFVLEHAVLNQLVQTPKKVFQDATVRTFIVVLTRVNSKRQKLQATVDVHNLNDTGEFETIRSFPQAEILTSHLYNFLLHSSNVASSLFTKISVTSSHIGDAIEFFYGFKTADDSKFLTQSKAVSTHEPYVRSADVRRYAPLTPIGYVDYRPDVMRAHRRTARPGDRSRFERPKIIVARMGRDLLATLDVSCVFVKDAMILLDPTDDICNLKIITAILNSKMMDYLYKSHFATIDVLKNALLSLPLPPKAPDKFHHDKMVSLVQAMLDLNKALQNAKTPDEKNVLQRQITATDNQIDQLVYELYNLTKEEIKIIEKN